MKNLVTLELRLRVTYKPNGVPVEVLKGYLRNIAFDAASSGQMTGMLEAEVEEYTTDVEEL